MLEDWIFLEGSALAQAVSHRLLNDDDQYSSQGNPWGICGGQSIPGTGFFFLLFSLPSDT